MSLDPRLRLRHFTTFMEVARVGSIVAAAEALHVTQPAISKTLRELEEILGRPLFDRVGRGLRLNSAGASFQKLTGAALGDLNRAQAAVRGSEAGRVKLAVGTLPTAASQLLPQAALALREDLPHVALRVSTGPNWLLLSQLREGGLDLVVGRMADPDQMAGLSFQQLYPEDIVAVVRPDHPLERLEPPDSFFDYPLILPPSGAVINPTVRGYLVSVGAGAVLPAYETVALAFGRHILQSSDAIWFISNGVVAEEVRLGTLRVVPLEHPMMAGPVGISLRADRVQSPELSALVAALHRTAANSDWAQGTSAS
ncbi:MAG: pca operon transcription factor PcaQ [Mangrovicoccus sp.]